MAREPLRAARRAPRFPNLPGYEIERVLGRGATGVVYRARQIRVGREVALKVLHPELAAQPRVVQRLQREARTTARLAHPHLVTAVDMGETEGRWWYAMEFVDGPSLALRLREEGRLKEREALRLFIPLCEALEHLFEHGVVHRDIKPANILIDKAGGARLADLGLAFDDEDDEELTKQGGTLGTPAYISPEQAVDPRDADVRSDIWSFGATLFHAVCGRPPFRAESAAEVLSCVLYARVPDPQELTPSLSRGLALVLRKCLTREPEHRYQVPRELLLDLERIRERRSPRIRRGRLDPVQRRHDPRSTWTVVAAIAVLALAATAWALGWGRGTPAEEGGAVEVVVAPYPPLEELAAEAGEDPSRIAQELSELAAMESMLPPGHLARLEEVRRSLRGRLKAEARALGDRTLRRFNEALRVQDFALARSVIGKEFEAGLLKRTGYSLASLATDLDLRPLGDWRARNLGALESAEGAALRQLAAGLESARRTRFDRVDRQLERQDWIGARRELLVDANELLAEAGGIGARFPADTLAGVLDPVLRVFEVRRQRLDDAWARLDHELRRAVIERSEALERQLAEGGRRYPPASVELREWFDRFLREKKNLEEDRMPEGLAHVAVVELEERAAELARIEDRLLQEELRTTFAETERLADIQWRGREYLVVQGIWEDVARQVDGAGGLPDAAWRLDLARTARLRVEEARRLRGLLDRCARSLTELDGQLIDLGVRGIKYEGRRLEAGIDPLEEGFTLDGVAEPLDLRTLAASELEALAGLGEEDELTPEGRLLVGLLRSRDGDYEGAQRMLRAGPLPSEGLAGDLALDLSVRVSDALFSRENREESRSKEASLLLGRATDPDRIAREPRSVVLWIDRLLAEFTDVPAVAAQREELIALRDRLRPGGARANPREEDYERVFGPTRFAQVFPDRVRLEFDFVGDAVGAWKKGDWSFDNRGWTPDPAASGTRLEDFRRQRGPTLILKWPLDAGAGEIDLTLTIEQPADPTRLLTISAAGFHVGFVGTHLPGQENGNRVLADNGSFADFLRRIEAGEGEGRPSLLRRGATHEIGLRMIPRAGKITVSLDGNELESFQLTRPDTSVATIVLRAMERVSLRRVTITAPR